MTASEHQERLFELYGKTKAELNATPWFYFYRRLIIKDKIKIIARALIVASIHVAIEEKHDSKK